eukprot:Gb_00877 [translate_table: standard]
MAGRREESTVPSRRQPPLPYLRCPPPLGGVRGEGGNPRLTKMDGYKFQAVRSHFGLDGEEAVKQVVEHSLGSDQEVTDMLNSLCKGIGVEGDYKYSGMETEIMVHYTSKYKVMFAEFVEEHCSKPWYAISLMVAVLLLLMTFLQTFFTIYSVYHK